jgi:hypothetical protein
LTVSTAGKMLILAIVGTRTFAVFPGQFQTARVQARPRRFRVTVTATPAGGGLLAVSSRWLRKFALTTIAIIQAFP